MIEFFQTQMGRKYYEHDLPELIKQLTRIADSMQNQRRLLSVRDFTDKMAFPPPNELKEKLNDPSVALDAKDRLNEMFKDWTPKFLDALDDFKKAANNLLDIWQKADHTGDYFNSDYPFKDDFETVVRNISQWHETQSNVGKQ